jgi:glyoxylase-like metal-dependent hydrolase (beta-lactamase superfamily II)
MFKGLGAHIAAELADVELSGPDIVYDDQAEIDLGGHRVALRSWGPAHSAGDQTVLVDERVLFGGDLFETRMFPIAPYFPPHDTDVDCDRWITVLDELIALDPAIVVPGHGEVTGTGLIRDVREYLSHVGGETRRLRESGVSADDAAATIEKDARVRWSTWANPEWIGFAVRAFYDA